MKDLTWLQRSVTYHVLIDRFHRGSQGGVSTPNVSDARPVFCGGNLQGVTEKLNYLVDLGVNALWLSPFTKTANYHGYHVLDHFSVDERFGGQKAFNTLVAESKAKGIRLIMDFVPSHVHDTHPWFQAARKTKRSRYRGWFSWTASGDYLRFLDVDELPKLNLDHPEPRAEIIRAAKHWIDLGIDGFRLDHVLGPSLGFWREFRSEIKHYRQDTALIGEVCFTGIRRDCLQTISLPDKETYYLAQQLGFNVLGATMREYAGLFDGLLDFYFQDLLNKMVARARKPYRPEQIQDLLEKHYSSFPSSCSMLSFLDNHDMNRFLFEARGRKCRLELAMEIQFEQSSPPIIYYGTETGMSQNKPVSGTHGDLNARGMMDWSHPDKSLVRKYKSLISKWRHRHQPTD